MDYQKAIKDYDASLRIDPNWAYLYIDRANAKKRIGDLGGALKDYGESIRRSPMALAHTNRGILWLEQKEYGKAIKDFEEAIRLDPKDATACRNLAWLLATCPDAKDRDGERALQLAIKARELSDGKSGRESAVLAASYAEKGQFAGAVHYETKALDDPEYRGSAIYPFHERLDLYKQNKPYRLPR